MSPDSLLIWLVTLGLISVRVSMLFVATPVFGSIPIPSIAKIVLIVGLSLIFSNTVSLGHAHHIDIVWLSAAVLHEIIIGAVAACGLFIAFSSFNFAGRILDFQIGFGISGLYDIATRSNAPVLGAMLSMIGVMIFLGIGGHEVMLRMLQVSFTSMPIGVGPLAIDFKTIFSYFGSSFVLGFALAAPVVICIFLIDIAISLMSRTMPQLNIFILSLGIKVIAGLLMLAVSLPFAGGLFQSVFEMLFDYWREVLA